MEPVKKLREVVDSILKMDATQRSAAGGIASIDPQFLKPGAVERLDQMAEAQLAAITLKNAALLKNAFDQLAQHDSSEAVDAIRRTFRSDVEPYRVLALHALSSMKTEAAKKAIAKRTSFWSFASNQEKQLAKSLLESAAARCAQCSKPLRSFPHPGGTWTGTVAEFAQMKLEPDRGLVCPKCRAVVCPECSGQKATELQVREFVCTACGARPLKEIYRA